MVEKVNRWISVFKAIILSLFCKKRMDIACVEINGKEGRYYISYHVLFEIYKDMKVNEIRLIFSPRKDKFHIIGNGLVLAQEILNKYKQIRIPLILSDEEGNRRGYIIKPIHER